MGLRECMVADQVATAWLQDSCEDIKRRDREEEMCSIRIPVEAVALSRALPFLLLRQVARSLTSTVMANRQANISGVLLIATVGQNTTIRYMCIVSASTRRPPAPEGAVLTCPWLHSSERLIAAYFQPCVVDPPSPARRSCSMQPQICSIHIRLIGPPMSGIHSC